MNEPLHNATPGQAPDAMAVQGEPMRTGPAIAPLLAALNDSKAAAAAAWKAWRNSVDIQHLTWPEMQILPILSGSRLDEWLADDPAAGVLRGIVRRAWTESQVRLALAREVVTCLRRAGCGSATLTGAAGAYLRTIPSTAIRPILELRVLVGREALARATSALEAEGWQSRDRVPSGEWLDRMTHIFFVRNGTRLYVHWRLLRTKPEDARACEREFFGQHRLVEALGESFRILSPGLALLEALAEREESVDALPWQADAAMILLEKQIQPDAPSQEWLNGEAIDWLGWSAQAARYQPSVFERIAELRTLGFRIPALRRPPVWVSFLLSPRSPGSYPRSAGIWARFISAVTGKA